MRDQTEIMDEDEYDDEDIQEDNDEEGNEQQEIMNRMRREQLKKEGRGLKSAYPRMRAQKSLIDIGKPQMHDLTKDQVGYGLRPSTAIQIQQLEMIQEYNKSLPKKKQN